MKSKEVAYDGHHADMMVIMLIHLKQGPAFTPQSRSVTDQTPMQGKESNFLHHQLELFNPMNTDL